MTPKRMRLTKSVVDRLQPADRDYEVADESLPGFYIRVYTSGAKTAVIRYVAGRRQRRYSIGKLHQHYTFARAREDAARKLREVRGGEDPSLDRRRRRQAAPFAEVAERFMTENARLKPRTVTTYRSLLTNHILPALGSIPMDEVQRSDVQQLHVRVGNSRMSTAPRRKKAAAKKTTAKGAANRVLSLVSAICNMAEGLGYRDGLSNPCRGIKRFPESRKGHDLTARERARIEVELAASEQVTRGYQDYVCHGSINAIRLISHTGARCGEISGLTWSMVDLDRGFLHLPDSKTGAKAVPLSRYAIELLHKLHAARDPSVQWVCAGQNGGRVQNLQRAWGNIRKRADVEHVRLHDFRHSLASAAAATGASLPIIGNMLGHTSSQTTEIYAHMTNAPVREALDLAGDRIAQQTRDGAKIIDLDERRPADNGSRSRRSAARSRKS